LIILGSIYCLMFRPSKSH